MKRVKPPDPEPAAPAPQQTGSPRRRAALVRLLAAVALFALVVVLVDRLVPGAGRRLSRARPGWLAAGVLLEAAACAGYVAFFHATFARAPCSLSRVRSVQIGLGELAGFAVVPAGIGGPAVRVWALLAERMPLRMIALRSISFAVVFNVPYVAAATALGLGALAGVLPGTAPLAVELAPIGLIALSAAVIAAMLVLARSDWLRRPGGWRARIRPAAEVVPAGVRDIPALIRSPLGLAGATGFWVLDCAALWASLHAVGGSPAVSVIALAYMLGQLGNLAPLPGGIGGVEPIMLGVLASSGIATGLGAAAVVCYRAIALGVQGASGAVALGTLVPALASARRSASAGAGDSDA